MPNIIINNICNQKCSYCFAEDGMVSSGNSLQNQNLLTYLQILRFLRKNHYNDVRILGGEPLLHPQIQLFLELANKGGFDVHIFSNLNFPTDYVKRTFGSQNVLPTSMNVNLNNTDFYSISENERIMKNILFLSTLGVDVTIGYNLYDLSKTFDDIASVARSTGVSKINLKITNTSIGNSLIVDTGSQVYGTRLFSIIQEYGEQFQFSFSCGLSPAIFTQSQRDYILSLGIDMPSGCAGFVGGFDIDIDGSIYKCFPTKSVYSDKGININNFGDGKKLFRIAEQYNSTSICGAHGCSS